MWLLPISILDITLQIIFDEIIDEINRQRRTLFVQGNIILQKFNMCSLGVKLTLFRTYCSHVYTAQLWWNYTKSTITKLQISYYNIF